MQDEGHIETDEIITRLEKKLKTIYSKATKDAAQKFTAYMTDFQRKDAMHLADVQSGKWTQDEYNQWRLNQLMYGQTLQEIRDTLAADLQNTNNMAMKLARGERVDIYALNFNYGTYTVEKGAKADTSFTLYDHDTVERLMLEDPDLLPAPSPKRQAEIDATGIRWNRQKLTGAFTASVLAGDSIPKMAGRIAGVAVMNENAAIRNARTMCTGAENAGRVNSYKRAEGMGIDLKQEWMATLDGRTRHSHRAIDGEKIEVGQKFSNGCRYPGDPEGPAAEVYNCRCTLVPVVDGIDPGAFDKSDTLQRKLGNADITYDEWKKQHQSMAYKAINLEGILRSATTKEGTIRFHKITSINGNFFLSERAKIKPRALHTIETQVNKAQENAKIGENKPDVVIVGEGDLGNNVGGRFVAETNTMYIRPMDDTAEQNHTIQHETFHCKDWQDNAAHGFKNDDEFISYMCRKSKKKLDKLGITDKNVGRISRYAKTNYLRGRYDEVYVEYRTREALKET